MDEWLQAQDQDHALGEVPEEPIVDQQGLTTRRTSPYSSETIPTTIVRFVSFVAMHLVIQPLLIFPIHSFVQTTQKQIRICRLSYKHLP